MKKLALCGLLFSAMLAPAAPVPLPKQGRERSQWHPVGRWRGVDERVGPFVIAFGPHGEYEQRDPRRLVLLVGHWRPDPDSPDIARVSELRDPRTPDRPHADALRAYVGWYVGRGKVWYKADQLEYVGRWR